jgi:hypothetical protein
VTSPSTYTGLPESEMDTIPFFGDSFVTFPYIVVTVTGFFVA